MYQDPNQVQRQASQRVPGTPSRRELVTALDLEQHLEEHVKDLSTRQTTPQAWSQQDYWSLVTFMLIAHGANVPASGVNADNASNVTIRP